VLPVEQCNNKLADRRAPLGCGRDRDPEARSEYQPCPEEQKACHLSGVERDRDGCQGPGHDREADPAFVDPGSPVGRRQVTGHRVPRSGTVPYAAGSVGGDVTAVLSSNMAIVWLA
jgi:hypothetical protein